MYRVTALLLLVCFAVACSACEGDNENPSPGPSTPDTPPSAASGASSTTEGTKTSSNGASGGASPDGGVKGDAGYFPGGSRLPQ